MKRLELQPIATHKPPVLSRFLSEPLSDVEILTIQDAFLTNGEHVLHVDNLTAGRRLIRTFLQSLDCFYMPACLTTSTVPLPLQACDMYADITRHIAENPITDLEEFFMDRFDIDFLWIEATENLEQEVWYADFEHQLKDMHIDQHIPIIRLKYRTCPNF